MKVAGYIRVSTGLQVREGYSLQDQRKEINEFCQYKKFELVKIFEDAGISGKTTEERPGFQSMMDEVKNGEIQGVIFTSLSRMGRNTLECLETDKELKKYGVKLFTLLENVDTTKGTGKLFFTNLAAFYEFELDLIRERTTIGKKQALSEGKWPWGGRPYGYQWNKDEERFEVIDEEAEGVKRIFELVLTGHSNNKIEAMLTAEGIPTKTRKPRWPNGSVKHIIRNELYSRPKAYNEDSKPFNAPSLVSVEDQDRAIAILDKKAKAYKDMPTREPRSDRILAHVLRCKKCGRPMIVRKSRHDYDYYVCMGRIRDKKGCDQPYIPVEKADDMIWEEVETHLLTDPTVWAKDWKETKDEKVVILAEKGKAEKALNKVRDQLDRAAQAILEGLTPSLNKTLERKTIELETQYEDITNKLRVLDQDLKEIDREEGNVKRIEMWSEGILLKLRDADKVTKRDFMRELFKGKIYVDWNLDNGSPFTPHGLCLENAERWLKEKKLIAPLVWEPKTNTWLVPK